MDNTKNIKIYTPGILPVSGLVFGPVLTPYYEGIPRIFEMVTAGVKVVEVLADKSEVKLDITNFDKDMTGATEVVTDTKEEKVEVISEPVVDEELVEVPEPAVDEVVTDTKEEKVEVPEPVVEGETVDETIEELVEVPEPAVNDTKKEYTKNNKRNNNKKR